MKTSIVKGRVRVSPKEKEEDVGSNKRDANEQGHWESLSEPQLKLNLEKCISYPPPSRETGYSRPRQQALE